MSKRKLSVRSVPIMEEREFKKDGSEVRHDSVDKDRVAGAFETVNPIVEDFFNGTQEFFSGTQDFWDKVDMYAHKFAKEMSTGDKFVEKYVREPIWELPLVGERVFFLNKSHSKWISVGLSPMHDFECMFKIVGIKKQCVSFNIKEWRWLMAETMKLKEYLEYGNGMFPCVYGMKIRLTPETIEGNGKIMRIEKGGDYVYLSYEGLLEMWRLMQILECRWAVLNDLKINIFYRDMVRCVAQSGGEVELEVEKMYNGVVSECACIMKELIAYWLQKIKNDVQSMTDSYDECC